MVPGMPADASADVHSPARLTAYDSAVRCGIPSATSRSVTIPAAALSGLALKVPGWATWSPATRAGRPVRDRTGREAARHHLPEDADIGA